eukprot:TRINITY_DN7066_c0_g1_i1.p1 TRINITY_DN7066_c0_g1~~TRINITY_DN7066_c0_g1_i1.p1  ORF type:complete len:265 (+),score=30.05 TRINITY_DN7066_c0_g1_i1:481-1275(+)
MSYTAAIDSRSSCRQNANPVERGIRTCENFGRPFFSANACERLILFGDRSVPSGKISSATVREREPVALLIFPEGTDLSPNNIKRSHAFAEKNGLPKFSHVLIPRSTGFAFCLQELRESIAAVYDITMGYVDFTPGERPSEGSLLRARWPREVHFHVERHPIESMPSTEEEVSQWVQSRFDEKETRLKAFYESKHCFEGQEIKMPLPSTAFMSCGFYGVVGLVATIFLLTTSLFRWMCLAAMVAFAVLSARGGADAALLDAKGY